MLIIQSIEEGCEEKYYFICANINTEDYIKNHFKRIYKVVYGE